MDGWTDRREPDMHLLIRQKLTARVVSKFASEALSRVQAFIAKTDIIRS